MKTTAIILAGGAGKRCASNTPKQFLKIGKKTLLELCLQCFQDHQGIDSIVLVCPQDNLAHARKLAALCPKVVRVLAGGRTRQGSSAIGVAAAVAEDADRLLIHDAARALVPAAVIGRVRKALARGMAVMPVLPASDTTVRVDDRGLLLAVLDREKLRRVQTPQGFRAAIIRQAHEMARKERIDDAPDDCSLIQRFCLAPVITVEGDTANIKITYPEDLAVAEAITNKKGKRRKAKGKR